MILIVILFLYIVKKAYIKLNYTKHTFAFINNTYIHTIHYDSYNPIFAEKKEVSEDTIISTYIYVVDGVLYQTKKKDSGTSKPCKYNVVFFAPNNPAKHAFIEEIADTYISLDVILLLIGIVFKVLSGGIFETFPLCFVICCVLSVIRIVWDCYVLKTKPKINFIQEEEVACDVAFGNINNSMPIKDITVYNVKEQEDKDVIIWMEKKGLLDFMRYSRIYDRWLTYDTKRSNLYYEMKRAKTKGPRKAKIVKCSFWWMLLLGILLFILSKTILVDYEASVWLLNALLFKTDWKASLLILYFLSFLISLAVEIKTTYILKYKSEDKLKNLENKASINYNELSKYQNSYDVIKKLLPREILKTRHLFKLVSYYECGVYGDLKYCIATCVKEADNLCNSDAPIILEKTTTTTYK